jgi:hypothetical protein
MYVKVRATQSKHYASETYFIIIIIIIVIIIIS